MSAEIDPLETKAGSDQGLGLDTVITRVDQLNIETHDADAADFFFSNSKYHDCFLVVGNPETDEVESIGTTSLHLIGHSPVFRAIIEDNKLNYPSESKMHVTDVSPVIFKLMLRYVYGGKLPQMTAIEAAGLALCADKFKIPRLVQKALKRLDPTSAEDVFPALICVSYIEFPELELKVAKIIQQETDKIVKNSDFLELDEDCLIFILKQDTLTIGELDLWKDVIRWAEHQVKLNPNRTNRDCLMKILGYVRFLTLTLEDIVEHVLPTKIITPEEFVDLTLTVTKKQMLESPLLCRIQERRNIYKEDVIVISAAVEAESNATDVSLLQNMLGNVFGSKPCFYSIYDSYLPSVSSCSTQSTLWIKPSEPIEIVTFTLFGFADGNCRCCLCHRSVRRLRNVVCNITVTKMDKDIVESVEEIKIEAPQRGRFDLPIKLKSGLPLVLNPKEACSFTLKSSHPLKACNVSMSRFSFYPLGFAPLLGKDNVTFSNNKSAVLQFYYRKQ